MSSIYGRINLDNKPIAGADLGAMESKLHHWHADDKGSFIKENAALGHLMLYNTPGSLHEPLPFYKNGITITSDARIDNRYDICTLLNIKDDETAHPDSRLILYLYEKYGTACVQHIIGDFAFAIWDEHKQQLFCARDHMGVKPFFYYHHNNLFAFATEKKGILAIPGIDKTIDKQFLYNQILWPPAQLVTDTLYQHIRRLPAAHTLTLDIHQNRLTVARYWTLDATTELKLSSGNDYYEGLRHHFVEAVKCRLRTVYTPGAELSGGLDSSAIVGAACKMTGNKLITFSNTSADGITDEEILKKSEREYIEAVINYNHIDEYVFVTEYLWPDPLDEADFAIKVNDGLEMWNPAFLEGLKHAAMKKNVRVLLSGFPGDELVTYKGQHPYLDYLPEKQYRSYFSEVRNKYNLAGQLMPLIPHNLGYAIHKLKNLLVQNDRRLNSTGIFHIPLKYRLNRGTALWKDEYHRHRYKDLRHFQRSNFLQARVQLRMEAETRFGIYYRLEPRFPLADIRLAQFYLSMPAALKHHAQVSRHTYRQAVKDYLPEAILQREKKQASMTPFISSKNRTVQKTELVKTIIQRLKEKNDLPVKVKNASYYAPVHLETLRWLELYYSR